MSKSIAQAFNEITVAQGGTPDDSGTIVGAIDALSDTLAGEDVASPNTVAGAITMLGDHIGGGATLITKNITANDTYDAADDGADGYSQVTVNVEHTLYINKNASLSGLTTGKNATVYICDKSITTKSEAQSYAYASRTFYASDSMMIGIGGGLAVFVLCTDCALTNVSNSSGDPTITEVSSNLYRFETWDNPMGTYTLTFS